MLLSQMMFMQKLPLTGIYLIFKLSFRSNKKKKLRKFKDECGANVIQELVGLRSKLNCYRV